MCGIVGVVGARAAAPILLEALRRLEYRGYDSAGMATLDGGRIERRRAAGKLRALAEVLEASPLPGTVGIGHTRWATHGAPTERNAHPHGTERVAVVHNGIIENYAELRAELTQAGQVFLTETDTETVAQLVDLHLRQGMDAGCRPRSAPSSGCRVRMRWPLIFAGEPELLVATRRGAPLAVGYGEDEMFVGSDALAVAPLTERIAYLEDGDCAVLRRGSVVFHDAGGRVVERRIRRTAHTGTAVGRGNFRHFMEKELFEHPAVIGDTLRRLIDPGTRAVALPPLALDFAAVPRLTLAACGSAFYAGLVGRYWFESLARLPTDADVASEFRISRAAAAGGRPWLAGQPVGRDGRHAGGIAGDARGGSAHPVDRQRAGEHDGARV